MTTERVVYHKVTILPDSLEANALYYVKNENSTYVDWVITDNQGNPNTVISNERIKSLVLPYDDSTLPQNGQILVFNGTNYVPQNLTDTPVLTNALDHITRTDNPHNVTEDQIPQGIDYTLLFENALI